MIVAALALWLCGAAHAGPKPQTDTKPEARAVDKTDLITQYGTNAELPPDKWSCGTPGVSACKKGTKCDAEPTPIQAAKELNCLTEWLWSVRRWFAAGGKVRPGLEPAFVAAQKARAKADAERLAKLAAETPESPAAGGASKP